MLRAGGWGARHHAVSLALTAAALGEEVHLALFGAALRRFLRGTFDGGASALAREAKVGSLTEALAEGRRDLGMRVVACDTALRLAGWDPLAAVPPLDAVESLPSLWRRGMDGRVLTV